MRGYLGGGPGYLPRLRASTMTEPTMPTDEALDAALARAEALQVCSINKEEPCDECINRAGWFQAVKALRNRGCEHQELYELRSDGASDIYRDIMHIGKCSDETACKPCSTCQALTNFVAAFPEESKGAQH